MRTLQASLFCEKELILGEGPVWHPVWQRFLYVDIEGMLVGCIDPLTGIAEERALPAKVGAVVPAADGNLVVALQGELALFDFTTGSLRTLTPLETDVPENRCNDAKCDPSGRLWVGTMHPEALPGKGALYRYDGVLRKMIDHRSISNGLGWSPDGRVFYYIDSYEYTVRAYDFDPVTGEPSNGRVVVAIREPGHMPDGLTVDEEGMLWVAIWGGGCVNRYDPFSGEQTACIRVDAPHVTSCTFGGKDMDLLLITTARAGLTAEQLNAFPLSGSLFLATTGSRGLPVHFAKIVH
jgi:sugar lactone lactonase YvrE